MKRAGLAMAVLMMLAGAGWAQTNTKPGNGEWYYFQYPKGLMGEYAEGYFHAVKGASEEKDAPVLFTYEFVERSKGKPQHLKILTWCRNDERFTPVRIVSESQRLNELFDARIGWPTGDAQGAGRLTATIGTIGTRKVELDIPARTTTELSVFEIVKGRPFDAEKVFEFHVVKGMPFDSERLFAPQPREAQELDLKDHKLTYKGLEELEIAGKKVKLQKFEETGSDFEPTQYWVNEGHELVRVVIDKDKEFLLTTEEKAKAGVK